MSRTEIKQIAKRKDLLSKYNVKSMALFGSFARGEERRDSDVDILIEFKNPTFRNYMGLLHDLEKLLGKKVDLVCKDALHNRIKPYILREAQPIN
jgi:predicted nucleotidyltransferase